MNRKYLKELYLKSVSLWNGSVISAALFIIWLFILTPTALLRRIGRFCLMKFHGSHRLPAPRRGSFRLTAAGGNGTCDRSDGGAAKFTQDRYKTSEGIKPEESEDSRKILKTRSREKPRKETTFLKKSAPVSSRHFTRPF